MALQTRPWQRSKPFVAVLVVGLAVVAVAAPIVAAIKVAEAQGASAATARVEAYARDALRRSEDEADQAAAAYEDLAQLVADGADPCSPAVLAEMSLLVLRSKYIQAFGTVSDDILVCSSLGLESAPIGPATTVTAAGARLHVGVSFPGDADNRYLVQEYGGFAAIVNPELPVDITAETGIPVAEFSVPDGQILASKGSIPERWITRVLDRIPQVSVPTQVAATFRDGDQFVSVITSSERYLGTIAVLPSADVDARARKAALTLVPIGAIAGLLLAGAVLFLARLQLALPAVLRTALRRRELFLEYQPIVDIETGRWVGAEALIRWRRPNGELVGPDIFVPIAEENGLSQKLTRHVVELLTPDLATIIAAHPDFSVSLNLTADDLSSADTIPLVEALIASSNVRPGCLTLEVTERGFLNHNTSGTVIAGLHDLGVVIAIDDFGTGYSSLSYLQNLDVDVIKIDKSFIDTLGTRAATSTVVDHIIDIAKSLDLRLVAEGVETDAQAALLLERGVVHAQGWLYSKSLRAETLLRELNRRAIGDASDKVPVTST